MNGDFALDTNIVIGYLAKDSTILPRIKAAALIAVPCIVLGELYFGAHKSGRTAENVAKLEELRIQNLILECDGETARIYGLVKQILMRKGKPIPENDIWIAAIAMQHNLILATRDAHFDQISGLQREAW